jgi:glycosyltransferase involved in cell wall biosynthesis
MRTCLICNEYPPAPHGGIGSMSRDLAEGLARAGHDITVLGVAIRLTNTRLTDEIQNGVRVVRVPRAPMWWPSPIRDRWHRWRLRRVLLRLHRARRFELVEAPDYQGWLSGGAARGTPLLIRIHGANFFFDTELQRSPNRFEHAQEIKSLRRASALAAPSAYAARRHLELAGMPERECEIIPNSVDASFFCPDASVPVDPGLIIYVNSLNPKKGIEQLLDAANLLLPRRPEAKLVVIGGDNMRALRGKYLEQLRERVAPVLRARVEFAGRLPREQVRDWMRRAEVCVFPSHMETFGIAPAEAMATGRPVIYSRLGPGPELVTAEVTGLLCDPYSPEDIAAKIGRLLSDTALAARVGGLAREKVLSFCDTKHWLQTNAAFYARCVEAARERR